MHSDRAFISVLLCACLFSFLPSCSFIHRVMAPAGHEKKFVDDTARQAQAHLALAQYKKALALYSRSYDKYHYSGMRGSYAGTGEQIRNTADAAYQRRDFAEAGSTYHALFESGITTRDFAHVLSFDDDYLKRQMKACSKALLEAGLTKYREGKLEDAISVWKKVLVFDHDNKDITSVIETTTTQLHNLKKIK